MCRLEKWQNSSLLHVSIGYTRLEKEICSRASEQIGKSFHSKSKPHSVFYPFNWFFGAHWCSLIISLRHSLSLYLSTSQSMHLSRYYYYITIDLLGRWKSLHLITSHSRKPKRKKMHEEMGEKRKITMIVSGLMWTEIFLSSSNHPRMFFPCYQVHNYAIEFIRSLIFFYHEIVFLCKQIVWQTVSFVCVVGSLRLSSVIANRCRFWAKRYANFFPLRPLLLLLFAFLYPDNLKGATAKERATQPSPTERGQSTKKIVCMKMLFVNIEIMDFHLD